MKEYRINKDGIYTDSCDIVSLWVYILLWLFHLLVSKAVLSTEEWNFECYEKKYVGSVSKQWIFSSMN